MEVNVPSSSSERDSISPSVSLTIEPNKRELLAESLNKSSAKGFWSMRMDLAGDSTESWDDLFVDILSQLAIVLVDMNIMSLTKILADGTDLCNLAEAKRVINLFNDTDRNKWKAGVEKALNSKDWDDLIAHRTYNFALGDLLLRRNSDISGTSSAKSTRIKVRSPQSTHYTSNLYYLKGE